MDKEITFHIQPCIHTEKPGSFLLKGPFFSVISSYTQCPRGHSVLLKGHFALNDLIENHMNYMGVT